MRKSAVSSSFENSSLLGAVKPPVFPSKRFFCFCGWCCFFALPTKARLRVIVRWNSRFHQPSIRSQLQDHDSLFKHPDFSGRQSAQSRRRGFTTPHWAKRAALHANGTPSSAHSRVPTSTSTTSAPPNHVLRQQQRWNGSSSWPAAYICAAIRHHGLRLYGRLRSAVRA
jgi:lambda repressor-like predicted transcriptional regulator